MTDKPQAPPYRLRLGGERLGGNDRPARSKERKRGEMRRSSPLTPDERDRFERPQRALREALKEAAKAAKAAKARKPKTKQP
jgi:hypothetical protein